MGKGFAPVLPTRNKAQLKPELPLTSINEIQASLLTYLQPTFRTLNCHRSKKPSK